MNNSEILGEEAAVRQIVGNDFSATNGHFEDDSIINMREYAFHSHSNIESVNFPNLKYLSGYTFNNCYKLKEFIAPNLRKIYGGLAMYFTRPKELVFPNYGLGENGAIESADWNRDVVCLAYLELGKSFSGASSQNRLIMNKEWWDAIVLRKDDGVALITADSFYTNGTGHVYVPRALISSYQTATNWSTKYAQQNDLFRAIEDYTVDGTLDGEIDRELIKTHITPVYSATNLEFNGTSDYVDTGVKLFDSDNKFTIILEKTADNGNTLLHCRDESTSNGLMLTGKEGLTLAFKPTDAANTSGTINYCKAHSRVILRSTGTELTYLGDSVGLDNTVGKIWSQGILTKTGNLVNTSNNLILGAKNTNGTMSSFWKGTIHKIKVYKGCLSTLEIREELDF